MKNLSKSEITKVLERALEEGRKVIPNGHVATYIPQLGTVDPIGSNRGNRSSRNGEGI